MKYVNNKLYVEGYEGIAVITAIEVFFGAAALVSQSLVSEGLYKMGLILFFFPLMGLGLATVVAINMELKKFEEVKQ